MDIVMVYSNGITNVKNHWADGSNRKGNALVLACILSMCSQVMPIMQILGDQHKNVDFLDECVQDIRFASWPQAMKSVGCQNSRFFPLRVSLLDIQVRATLSQHLKSHILKEIILLLVITWRVLDAKLERSQRCVFRHRFGDWQRNTIYLWIGWQSDVQSRRLRSLRTELWVNIVASASAAPSLIGISRIRNNLTYCTS